MLVITNIAKLVDGAICGLPQISPFTAATAGTFLIHLSQPEYYSDTLCRNGQFNGWQEALSFVKKVHRHWHRFQRIQQSYSDSIREVILTDNTIRIMQ